MAQSRSMGTLRGIRLALIIFGLVLLGGTVGYVILGFRPLEALYQTVTTVTTVGFREVHPLDSAGQIFTIVLILAGVGTALYTFSLLLEGLIEGRVSGHLEKRHMLHEIEKMSGHAIVCGGGRVGMASAAYMSSIGRQIVLVDRDPARLEDVRWPKVVGDVTDDRVLETAGIARARALIAALDTDADNVFVTLSARALRPDLVIIARARTDASKSKLIRAGANRAVNPQLIGGRRMAAFALHPHVAEFLDVVMHDETLDFRIEQIDIAPDSPLAGRTLDEVTPRGETGVLLLAIRRSAAAPFTPSPAPDIRLEPGSILIAVGTPEQLETLRRHARGT